MASSSDNWLVVGLGNPGAEYELTRHNLGFRLLDKLAERFNAQIKRTECRALIGRAIIEGITVELAKPQTFMNLSGEAVSCLVQKPERSVRRLIVISDDLALPLGKIRLRTKGSHGGQNGLRSIIDRLRTNEFTRLRVGIAPEHPISNASNFVLERFSGSELDTVENVLDEGAGAVCSVITDGVEKAMSRWNSVQSVNETE